MTVKEFITDPIIFGEELFAKAKEMQTKTVRACDVLAKIDEELSTMPEPFKMDFICLVTKAVDKCENMNKDDKYDEFGFFNPFSAKDEEKSEDCISPAESESEKS